MAFAYIWEARVRLICFCAHPRSDDICLCLEPKDHVPHLVTQEMDKLQMCTFLFSLIPPAGFARPPSHPKAHRGEAGSCDGALMESSRQRMTGQFGSAVDFRPRGQIHTHSPPRLRRPLQESHHRDFPQHRSQEVIRNCSGKQAHRALPFPKPCNIRRKGLGWWENSIPKMPVHKYPQHFYFIQWNTTQK